MTPSRPAGDSEEQGGSGVSVMLWRRLDQPGHDMARLAADGGGWRLEGTALFHEAGTPWRLDYVVRCDATWRTTSARVTGWRADDAIDLRIAADEDREWTIDGRRCPEARGCADVDLSFTPATNLLPIRRLALTAGAAAAAPAAWLRFPECTLERLDQRYTRLDTERYAYESGGGAFRTTLEVAADGWIIHYPGLWRCEPEP